MLWVKESRKGKPTSPRPSLGASVALTPGEFITGLSQEDKTTALTAASGEGVGWRGDTKLTFQ